MTNEQSHSITGAIHELSDRVLTILPPAFIALIIVNVLFIATVLLFEFWQMDARAQLIGKLIEGCLRVADRPN
jgi:hypothetical protein